MRGRVAPVAVLGLALLALPAALVGVPRPAAAAEQAWVRGAPLNLRSGAGTQYRIIGSLAPGDPVQVLERGDGWTRVRIGGGTEGWIAAGYLEPVAPPLERVDDLEGELQRARAELEGLTREAERLRSSNESLSSDDSAQREELGRLTRENAKLRAGERWAEWIAGALIFCSGMAAGAILSRLGGRRNARRLKL
jgi:uncharacterized protein YgiM (DUF1202 family)